MTILGRCFGGSVPNIDANVTLTTASSVSTDCHGSLLDLLDPPLYSEVFEQTRAAKEFLSSVQGSQPSTPSHTNVTTKMSSTEPINFTGITRKQYRLSLELRRWVCTQVCQGSFKVFRQGTNPHQTVSAPWARMQGSVRPQLLLVECANPTNYLKCVTNMTEKQLTIGDILFSSDRHPLFAQSNTLNGILSMGLYVYLLHHTQFR